MPINTNLKQTDGSFFSGAKWQSLDPILPTDKEVNSTIEKLKNGKLVEPVEYERAINYYAWSILHFANSQWGNDYYGAVMDIAFLAAHHPSSETFKNPVKLNK